MELLTLEKTTCFDHDIFHREEFLNLLHFSPELERLHKEQLAQYSYSFIQDGYYSLIGCAPDASPLGKGWSNLVATPTFQSLPPLMVDLPSTATTVKALNQKIMEVLTDVRSDAGPKAIVKRFKTTDLPLNLTDDVVDAIDVGHALSAFMDGTKPSDNRGLVEKFIHMYNVKVFSKLLGWAKNIVGGESRKMRASTGEFTRYTPGFLGDSTSRVDLINLALGDKQTTIAAADGQLQNNVYVQEQPAGRGPVVLLVDRSWSMSEKDVLFPGYTKYQSARSFELALATAFNEEGRDLISILWDNSPATPTYTYGDPGLEDHLKWQPNGGTVINRGLQAALNVVDEYYQNADICIITDGFLQAPGQYSIKEYAKELAEKTQEFKSRGGRIWAIMLDTDYQRGLWSWCDGVAQVSTLADTDTLSDILSGMAKNQQSSSTGNWVL